MATKDERSATLLTSASVLQEVKNFRGVVVLKRGLKKILAEYNSA